MSKLLKTSSAPIINPKFGTHCITLENGVRVVFDAMPYVKSATVGIWVNIGTRYENADENGIAHLLEHMVFKGAGGRNATQLAEDAEARGIYLNAATSYERTGFYARTLSDEVAFAFDLCADLVLKPRFDENDFALEKNVVLHEINEAFDDAEDRAGVLNQLASFNNQALGRPILGDEKSLMDISHSQLLDFHTQYLNPHNIIIGFGGAFDEELALAKVQERFANLKGEKASNFAKGQCTNQILFEKRKTEQLQLVLSMFLPKSCENTLFAGQIMAAILGGGMASRLFQDLREKRGLVYGIDAYPEKFIDLARLNISAGAHSKSIEEITKRILGHIEDLAQNGARIDEIARAKKTIATSILMSFENSSSRLSAAINQIAAFGKIFNADEISNAINKVEATQIKDLAIASLDKSHRAAAAVGEKGQKAIEDFLIL